MSDAPIRVAVVDDDRSVRNALRRLLNTAGFHTGVFESGREFLGSVHDCQPDCLIVDLNMPGMTGRELLGKVLERHPRLPVIFMTATEHPELLAEYVRLGASVYLPKPIEEKALIGAIGAALKMVEPGLREFVSEPELDQGPLAATAAADS